MCSQENLGGKAKFTPDSRRAQNATQASAMNASVPATQPESTKELSRNLRWTNLHIIDLDSAKAFQCVQQRSISADLFGTLVLAVSVLIATVLVRFAVNDWILPAIAKARGVEAPEGGFLLFPSLETVVYDIVRPLCSCVRVWCCSLRRFMMHGLSDHVFIT
jgi:hypothetical protein